MKKTERIKFILFQLLVLVLILFQILDGSCTYIGLLRHGIGIEGNPLIVYLISIFGYFWGLAIPKGIGILLILFIYNAMLRSGFVSRRLLATAIILNIFYAWIVYNWIIALIFGIP